MPRIAVVDDDEGFLAYLAALLGSAGYAVRAYATAGKFLDSLSASPPDAAVLDLHLPGVSGWELIRIVKELEATREAAVIAVSGEFRRSEHVVRALALGADEFFSKPIEAEVFLAKVAALLRRTASVRGAGDHDQKLAAGAISMNVAEHTARAGAKEVRLTPLEFDLLAYLIRNRNRVLTRGIMLQQVWKSEPSQCTRTVDKRVEALRRKLGRAGSLIQTVSGVGYCLRCS